jgi:hypothetical protein
MCGFAGLEAGWFYEVDAMERLLVVDKQEYAARMQVECRRIMESIMEAVNSAPTGNVISGSEMQVRDLMAQLRQKAFETAVQMRIDSTESSFSPAEGLQRPRQTEQRPRQPQRGER